MPTKGSQFLFVGALLLFGFSAWHYSIAAQNGAKNPLALYDAKGTFVGNILGVSTNSSDTTYVTYLPSLEGILQLGTTSGVQFDPLLSLEYFDQPNCQGNVYTNPGIGQEAWTYPWIVRGQDGVFYRIATSSVDLPTYSTSGGVGSCINSDSPYPATGLYKLTPITLPFNPTDLVLPFSIRG